MTMRFLKYLAFVALMALVSSPWATQKEVPLTLKKFGKTSYYQWTGSFVTLTADTVSWYVDTTNNYAMNPSGFLFDRKVGMDREDVVPTERFPEKLCAYFVGRSDADTSATAWDAFYSTSRSGTAYLAQTTTGAFNGTTVVGAATAFTMPPGLFPVIKSRITTATDSVVYSQALFWGCDD
jgi:hypothetical protein